MYYASIRSPIQETHGLIKQSVLSQIQLQRIPSWHTGQSDFTASPAENMSLHLAHATTTPHNWQQASSHRPRHTFTLETLSEVSHMQKNRNPIQSVTDGNAVQFSPAVTNKRLRLNPPPSFKWPHRQKLSDLSSQIISHSNMALRMEVLDGLASNLEHKCIWNKARPAGKCPNSEGFCANEQVFIH